MDQTGDHMKMNFEYFEIQKWMLQTVKAEKVDEKMWLFVRKKSKSIKAIYIDASERSCYALSENGIAYYAIMLWLTVLEILRFEVKEFC